MQITHFFLAVTAAVVAQGCHFHEELEEIMSSVCHMFMDGSIPYMTDSPIPEDHTRVSYIEENPHVLPSLELGPMKRVVLSDIDDVPRWNSKHSSELSALLEVCDHFLEAISTVDDFVPPMTDCDEPTLTTHDVTTMHTPALPTAALSGLIFETPSPTEIITTSKHSSNETGIATAIKSAHAAPHQTGIIMAAAAMAALAVVDMH